MTSKPRKKTDRCNVCQVTFNNSNFLKRHMVVHAEEHPYACTICYHRFRRVHELGRHKKTHVRGQHIFPCKCCRDVFMSQKDFDDHLKECRKKRPYKCFCGLGFVFKGNLISHQMSHSAERPVKCTVCNMTFKREVYMRSHRAAIHFGEKRYQCKACNKSFFQHKRLISHQKKAHNYTDFLHKCQDCGQVFKFKSAFNVHMKSHRVQLTLKCLFCGESFSSYDALRSHKQRHSSKCDQCGIVCSNMDTLLNHKVSHRKTSPSTGGGSKKDTESKVFCDICSEGFRRFVNLSVHQRRMHDISKDENKWTSNPHYIPTAFSNVLPEDRKIHGRNEEVPIRLPCGVCGIVYKRKFDYFLHMNNVHGEHTSNTNSVNSAVSSKVKPKGKNIPAFNPSWYKNPGAYKYICKICDRRFSMESRLVNHIHKVHFPEESFAAEQASSTTIMATEDSGQMSSLLLGEKNLNAMGRTQDGRKMNEIESLKPELNSTDVKNGKQASKLNQEKETSSSNKIYQCNVCNRIFNREKMLRVHEERHTSDEIYEAELRRTGNPKDEDLFICDLCNSSFVYKKDLIHHIQQHDIEQFEKESKKSILSQRKNGIAVTNKPLIGPSPSISGTTEDDESAEVGVETSVFDVYMDLDDPLPMEEYENCVDEEKTTDTGRMEGDSMDTTPVNNSIRPALKVLSEDCGSCALCKECFLSDQDNVECFVCSKQFCLSCEEIQRDTYNAFKEAKHFLWICTVCRPMVSVLSVLNDQLKEFSDIIDTHMGQLEKRVIDVDNSLEDFVTKSTV